jgi:hypothetical protein
MNLQIQAYHVVYCLGYVSHSSVVTTSCIR